MNVLRRSTPRKCVGLILQSESKATNSLSQQPSIGLKPTEVKEKKSCKYLDNQQPYLIHK